MSHQFHNNLKINEDNDNYVFSKRGNDQLNLKIDHIDLKESDQDSQSLNQQQNHKNQLLNLKNKNDEINNILLDTVEKQELTNQNIQSKLTENLDIKTQFNGNVKEEENILIEIQKEDELQTEKKNIDTSQSVDSYIINQHAINQQQRNSMKNVSNQQNLISFIESWSNLKGQNLSELKKLIEITPNEKKNSFFELLNGFCGVVNPNIKSAELLRERDQILAIAKMQFNDKDNLHFQMLYSVYCTLTSNYYCPEIGYHWEYIGFQGIRPQTDFRGTGILGLLQMLAIVTRYKEFMIEVLECSHDPVHNFPLCVALINVTDIVLQACREQKLNSLINREKSVINVFNNVYFATFHLLYTIYKQQKMTIVQFTELRQNVEFTVKQNPKKVVEDFKVAIQQYYKFRPRT